MSKQSSGPRRPGAGLAGSMGRGCGASRESGRECALGGRGLERGND